MSKSKPTGRTYSLVDAQGNLWEWTCRLCRQTNQVEVILEAKSPCSHCDPGSGAYQRRLGNKMTVDEFTSVLTRFDATLTNIAHRSLNSEAAARDTQTLIDVLRDLDQHRLAMEAGEKPTRPLPDPPLKPSDVNAEAIGTLQAKVAQLEGQMKDIGTRLDKLWAISGPGEVTTLRQRLSHVEGNPERIKTLDYGDGSVPE